LKGARIPKGRSPVYPARIDFLHLRH
jgi:hypothetical protein